MPTPQTKKPPAPLRPKSGQKRHLIIGDPHAHYLFPEESNKAADALGKFIAENRFDVVVNMGDTADMPSLASISAMKSYDVEKKGSTIGRSYQADIAVSVEWHDRVWRPSKGNRHQPFKCILGGNHEDGRLLRCLDLMPELKGWCSLQDFQREKYYDEVVSYQDGGPGSTVIDGILYSHYFANTFGKALSGVNHSRTLLNKLFCSAVCAHSHDCQFYTTTNGQGSRLSALVAGCYIPPSVRFSYATELQQRSWWRGVIVAKVEDGNFTPEFITFGELARRC